MQTNRRRLLELSVAGAIGLSAGCLGILDDDGPGDDASSADGTAESDPDSLGEELDEIGYTDYIAHPSSDTLHFGVLDLAVYDDQDDDDDEQFAPGELEEEMLFSYAQATSAHLNAAIRLPAARLGNLIAPGFQPGVEFESTRENVLFVADGDQVIAGAVLGDFDVDEIEAAIMQEPDPEDQFTSNVEFADEGSHGGRNLYRELPDQDTGTAQGDAVYAVGETDLIFGGGVESIKAYIDTIGADDRVIEQNDEFATAVATIGEAEFVAGGNAPNGHNEITEVPLPGSPNIYAGSVAMEGDAEDREATVDLVAVSDDPDEEEILTAVESDVVEVDTQFDEDRLTATATYDNQEFRDALGDAIQ